MFHILFFTSVLFIIERPSFPDTGGWAATYGGHNIDWAESIQQARDGGYIVGGYYKSYSVSSPFAEGWGNWVLKLRPDGTVEWQKAFGGNGVESVQQTDDGGYVAAGTRWYFGDWGEVINLLWVLKLRHDGTVEWQAAYKGAKNGRPNSIKQTLDGGYIVAGWTDSFGAGDEDLWVLKLRADASVEWQKTYGGVDKDEAKSIQQTGDGGYIAAGVTRSFGAGDQDIWVLKLSANGTVEWQKSYGGIEWDAAESIQQTRDGGYIVAGKTASFDRYSKTLDLWVLKLSPDGSICPSCNFVMDTSTSGIDSNAAILQSNATVRDSNAGLLTLPIQVMIPGVSANILCP
jgi:hypothetical protein